jgi:hypothetical protein
MSQIIRSEMKHYSCSVVNVSVEMAEAIRTNPNGTTNCPVCGETDSNLRFSSLIEFDDGYILESTI